MGLRGICMDRKIYDYWLYALPYIGKKTFLRLLEEGYVSDFLYECTEEKLPSFLSEKQKASIIKGRHAEKTNLENAYKKLEHHGIYMTVYKNPDYPEKLYSIPDPPAVLFYKGSLSFLEGKNIAVIGARNCSEYGKYVARRFASCFAKNGVTVISGMAGGIDGHAQKEAILQGGSSVGVLGSGVEVCYPAENYGLYQELIKKGCVLSEYLPYVKASANLFPPRNRIISGLADALVVIEAREKSGTLITVEMALEQGKEVYVVPGRITDELSKGCNKLLWEGAYPAVSPEKVLESLYGDNYADSIDKGMVIGNNVQNMILSFLEMTPVHIDILQQRTGLPMEVINKEIFLMTLEGMVMEPANGWYCKTSE